ncbi:flagellar hook-basal body complex protein FliE [Oxalobacteraceae bacterium OM1]|nr:flagellar hook-basal body complex protein FliE [Oxalobacteraceae bacterium OM1]
MKPAAIDPSRIQSMIAQLKAAATRQEQGIDGVKGLVDDQPAAKVDFASALKASLDQVNGAQQKAEDLGKRFTMGDDSVNLSDVMISMQKANIGFQATVQVRNKLVSAYHDIMNMQI